MDKTLFDVENASRLLECVKVVRRVRAGRNITFYSNGDTKLRRIKGCYNNMLWFNDALYQHCRSYTFHHYNWNMCRISHDCITNAKIKYLLALCNQRTQLNTFLHPHTVSALQWEDPLRSCLIFDISVKSRVRPSHPFFLQILSRTFYTPTAKMDGVCCIPLSKLYIPNDWTSGHQTRYTWSSSSSFLACNSRFRSAIRRPHHSGPYRCFGQSEMMGSQILLYGAQPCDAGASSRSPPVLRRESWQDPLGICVVVHNAQCAQNGSGEVTYAWCWSLLF